MSKKQSVTQSILSTKMDRKEFLMYAGALFVTFTGIGAISKTLLKSLPQSQQNAGSVANKGSVSGYGMSPYGK